MTKVAVSQTVVNSSGGHAIINGQTHEFNIGEVIVHSGTTLIVTQGLLQPKNSIPNTGSIANLISNNQLNIFPVPTKDILNLKANFPSPGTLIIKMTDIAGKLILTEEFQLSSRNEINQIDLGKLSEGNYIIHAEFRSLAHSSLENVFQLTKIQ